MSFLGFWRWDREGHEIIQSTLLVRMLHGSPNREMVEETGLVLRAKVKRLAAFVRASKYAVVYTGAGISTAAGVPDFRGPSRVWTLQAKGKTLKPTLTHNLLRILLEKGHIRNLVTQNIDSLHLRSGVPSEKQTELHGNYCLETCPVCDTRYFRSHAVWEGLTLPFSEQETDHKTGRFCKASGCSGELESSVVLFGESLSVKIPSNPISTRIGKLEVKSAWEHTSKADLALVLGSSLRVAPARAMPGQVARNCGRLVLVNLQRSHFDGKASLVIYARCDEVMRLLAEERHLDTEEPCRQEGVSSLTEFRII